MNGWVCVQSGKVVINNSDKVAQLITLKASPGLQIEPHVAVIVFGIRAGWWKFLKISQQNVLEWASENCDILRRPIDGTEYLSWLFLNDMRLYCWTKCITISNAFLEIDRHLNLLLPHFLHFGITQKTCFYCADQILLNPLRSVKNTRPVFPQVRSRDAVSVWEWSSAIELGCTVTQYKETRKCAKCQAVALFSW